MEWKREWENGMVSGTNERMSTIYDKWNESENEQMIWSIWKDARNEHKIWYMV